ncbi:nad-binding domain of hmg-CoA reductase [Gymnopus androsaceus JB14]|uniref:hydroxymethylglutaryl-CoA reductase (NADPH) n=1 Tax=Gymnopus androsaceus JB14 TaxID=1447944 RepID=A0A6A4GJF2_9AGAR|nr:nad-binding domain of hmg-CoA reductase [Gymnopus androsaceus JB14]
MATAEGILVVTTFRGCKAPNAGGGVTTLLIQDAPKRCKAWIDSVEGYGVIKEAFESTSRFARLGSLKCTMAGRTVFTRFATVTGDPRGMNMIRKGTEKALEVLQKHFPNVTMLALLGNYCTNKKPATINWIEGRGRIVKSLLKTTVEALVNLNTEKNLIGECDGGEY